MTNTLESSISNAPMHHILVVDDEEIVLVALRETLHRDGYKVVACSSAIEALTILKQQPFSVIISDQQMPMITGLEFLSQVKQIQPDATRILITAVLSLSTVIDAINKGEIYRFVVKPWLREDLLATIRNAVQRYELVCKNLVLQATTRAMNEKLSKLNKALEEQVATVAAQNKELEQNSTAMADNFQHAVELSTHLLQACHPSLAEYAERTVSLCRGMGAHLKLARDERITLETSAWLQDIGLINLPRDLVERWCKDSGAVSTDERAMIERHPVIAAEMAVFKGGLNDVGLVIRAHHERHDGSGYPSRLKGDEIPPLARLLAAATAYVESGHDKAALQKIEHGSGTTFDPTAVKALLRCVRGDA